MVGDDDSAPEPNDPLAPYAPSAVPEIPGDGRRWVAVLLSLLLLAGAGYGLIAVGGGL